MQWRPSLASHAANQPPLHAHLLPPTLQWGDLHGTRTLLGAAALGAALYGTHACLTSK